MKHALLVLLLFIGLQSLAQDRIVTTSFDTIICKIIEVNDFSVIFLPNTNRESDRLPLLQVLNIEKDVTDDIKRLKKRKINVEEFYKDNAKGWSLAASISYGYILNGDRTSSNSSRSVEQLRNGFSFGLKGTYFFGRYFGLGGQYTMWHTQNSFKRSVGVNTFTGNPFVGPASNNITHHFAAARFTARIMTKNRQFFFLPGIALGYAHWINQVGAGSEDYTIELNGFGQSAFFNFHFKVTPRIYAGFDSSIFLTTSNKVTYGDDRNSRTEQLSSSNRFGVLRIDVGLSINYYL